MPPNCSATSSHDSSHEGRLVIASHHDMNTVSRLFDEALILATGQLAFGPVSEVLTTEMVEKTFATA